MSETRARQTYHHGDLGPALLAAGIELAREGGPDAVVLRETTRRVGVSPNAAYRHFADRDALLAAVSDAALATLATAIDALFDAIPQGTRESVARAQLRAVGTGYVAFALDEPGLFRTAFFVSDNLERSSAASKSGPSGRSPLELLTVALDAYVASGIMPADRRPKAEFLAWSSVHGFALLCIDGPLRTLPRDQADAVTQRVIDMVEAGFTAP
ncbi:MAG: TetR/AcrR family transcriptional regulator [Salinibacterium sp.]|nr:TetR/AcrR family transcriptional regulator [Salinibacterium sp.]